MKPGQLLINEMFASVQGEGMYVGTPMLFIRTAGCNLRCVWCDQPDSVAEGFRGHKLKSLVMEVHEVMEWVRAQGAYKHVCLTGGEPTLQDLTPLVVSLQSRDYMVHVETNGTRVPDWLFRCDHVCVSPKEKVHNDVWDVAHEIKIIVDHGLQLRDVLEMSSRVHPTKPVYLQPANGMDSLDKDMMGKAMSFLQAKPWHLRLSVQLHKVLGVH